MKVLDISVSICLSFTAFMETFPEILGAALMLSADILVLPKPTCFGWFILLRESFMNIIGLKSACGGVEDRDYQEFDDTAKELAGIELSNLLKLDPLLLIWNVLSFLLADILIEDLGPAFNFSVS